MSAPRVLVVGGGLAGLVAGQALLRAGLEPLVLEADPEPGGKLHTLRDEGWLVERGPQTWLGEEGDALTRAIDTAGLRSQVLPAAAAARRRLVLRRGRLCAVPRELHRALSPEGLLRALAEPFVPRRRRGPPESVFAFARRRFGSEVARVLVDALVTGIWAGDPTRLELMSALPRLWRLEQEHGGVVRGLLRGGLRPRKPAGFREGMGQLAAGLAALLGPRLRLGAPVSGLVPPGTDSGLWTAVAGGAEHAGRALVLAAPPWEAAPLLTPHAPALAAELAAIPVAPVAAVALGWPASAFARGAPEGFGFLVPHLERRLALGCIFVSSLFPAAAPPGRVLLRVLVGGRRRPDLVTWPAARLIAGVRAELEELLHVRGEPELARVIALPRAIPQYELGHAARLGRIEALRAALPRLHLTGNGYRGVALGEVAADAERVALRVAAACGASG